MRLRAFFIGILLSATFIVSSYVYAQTPIPTGTGQSDLGSNYTRECVTVDEADQLSQKGHEPGAVNQVHFSGTCSSSTSCHLVICGVECDRPLEETENSKGETVQRCLGEKQEFCTTFKGALDKRYFGQDNTKVGLPQVRITGDKPFDFPSGTFSSIPGTIYDPHGHRVYSIYAISEPGAIAPATTGKGAGNNVNDENPSQQLGSIQFTFPPTGQPTPATTRKSCTSIFWDPYGRVFDSVSLEPLNKNEARVTLLDKDGGYVNVPSNNTPIDNLGKYNIFIEKDGLYTLKVDSMKLHDFVSVNPDPKYLFLYGDIFKAGDKPFEEIKTSPKRIDIPVKPKSTPYNRTVDWVYKNQGIVLSNGSEYVRIELRATHPLTVISTNIPGGVKCQQNGFAYTDKDGYCLIMIKSSVVPQDGVKIELIKNPDYYLYGKKSESVKISDSSLSFEPILRYLEGYAYDAKGQAIPKAKIEIRYVMNDMVYYTTTADDAGFFTIYKKNLPPFEFYLKFIDPNTLKTATQTTSEFIKNNKSYIDSGKFNFMAGTKNQQSIINPATGKLNETVESNNATSKNAPTPNAGSLVFNKFILLGLVLVVLVVAVLGIVIYIKQQNKFVP